MPLAKTVTPYDRSLLIRTLLVGLVALLVATGIVMTTDEAHSTVGMRVARLCTMTPALAAVAQAATLSLARQRGEARALESLGLGPWGVARGAMLAAWLLGAVSVGLLLLPVSDVSSLFPAPPVARGWVPDGDAMLSSEHGIRITRDGAIGFASTAPSTGLLVPSRIQAMALVLPLALVLPAWLVIPGAVRSKVGVAAVALAATLLLLHAVAARRAPTIVLPLAALPLVVQLMLELGRSRRRLSFFRAILGQGGGGREPALDERG